jgi:hypothetical protein
MAACRPLALGCFDIAPSALNPADDAINRQTPGELLAKIQDEFEASVRTPTLALTHVQKAPVKPPTNRIAVRADQPRHR